MRGRVRISSRSSLRNAAPRFNLLKLVDTRIIDDINVIQMAGVYTPSSIAIQDHRLAIKIHERPPCNFVFTCLYALIRSRIRPIPEFEHFPQWKAAVFVTYPRKFSPPQTRVGGG